MANGGDIIIRGGSVDIDFDDAVYPKEPGQPRSHIGRGKTISRVEVVDGSGTLKYDSGEDQSASMWKITVYCN